MGKLFLKKYQNNNRKMENAYGKWYLRAKHQGMLNTRELAEHIAKHGSIYTRDIIYGVVSKAADCIAELVKDGYKVKLDGLGTFYLAVKSAGKETSDDLGTADVVLKHLRFTSERSRWSDNATENMTLRAVVTMKDPYQDKEDDEDDDQPQEQGQGSSIVEDQP